MLRLLESYDVEELQTMVPALLRSAGKHRLKGITKPVAITAVSGVKHRRAPRKECNRDAT